MKVIDIYQLAAWSVITGLSLMLIGGLVLWAYGERQPRVTYTEGPEAEATQNFHQSLSRWFLVYGSLVIALGLALLVWAATIFP